MSLAGYTMQLARLAGVTDQGELEQIAVGALVHDVGARNLLVDPSTNPGRWSAEERDQVERHPQVGYESLLACDLTHGELMMAYQHHERADGSGYPVGVLADEIHPWARMLAITDRFEALTTARSYRRARELAEALDLLAAEAEIHLDAELTRCWIRSLESK